MAIYTLDSVFEKMEQQDFDVIPQSEWLQDFAAHIEKQIEPDNGFWNDERSEAKQIECLPKEVKTIYYLWWFIAFTGGGGLEVFTAQGEPHMIEGAYQSLLEIEGVNLAQYVADAVFLAINNSDNKVYSYEFIESAKDLSWFRGLKSSGLFDSISAIDNVFFDELDVVYDLSVEYIKKNLDKLVE